MGWVLRLVETETDSPGPGVDVMEIGARCDLGDIAHLGLTLAEAKQLLARVQQAVVAVQAHGHSALRPDCSSCGGGCHIKDWRLHRVATLFGVWRCGCRGFAASAVVIARRVSIGRRIVGRHRSWTSSERIFPPWCRIVSPLAYCHIFCLWKPGRAPRPCSAIRSRSAGDFATPQRSSRLPRRRASPSL